jgi:hypothetical protein
MTQLDADPAPQPHPSPYQLWQQAQDEGGTKDERGRRYIELMVEHGHIIDREPGDDSPLFACGYDPRKRRP